MADDFTVELHNWVEAFKKRGFLLSREGEANTYKIRAKNFQLKIKVNPKSWVGLEFDLLVDGGKTLSYHTDTDLYDLSNPKYEKFTMEIWKDITLFLDALLNEGILVGERKGRIAMIVPESNGFNLIRKG